MLRIAINQKHGQMSSVSRDGIPMLDIVKMDIHLSVAEEAIVRLEHVEYDGLSTRTRDEVIRGDEEPMEIVVV